jgi:hypothetical protein
MKKNTKVTSKVQDIIAIHTSKLEEFSEHSVNKKIKTLKKLLKEESDNDSIIEKKHKQNYNSKIFEKIERLKSSIDETEYIYSTYDIINKYIHLENDIQDALNNNLTDKVYNLNKDKANVIDSYMKIIDPDYVSKDIRNSNFCSLCNSDMESSDGHSVCVNCGMCSKQLHLSEEPGFKELQEREYKTQFTYQKETHLEDWLRRFQAKENKHIPQEIIDKVILEAHKQRITDLSLLTEIQVKKYLKKLKLNEYYDNVISIINRINKRPQFLLTQEIETKIKEMFKQIQEPFAKFKDPSRKNMLSYSYLLHHFFLILGLPEFSKYFSLLKSPDKLRQQDQTFKKIIDELSKTDKNTPWKFYPSI